MANEHTVTGKSLRIMYDRIVLKNPYGDNPGLFRIVHERGTHPRMFAPIGLFDAKKRYRYVERIHETKCAVVEEAA